MDVQTPARIQSLKLDLLNKCLATQNEGYAIFNKLSTEDKLTVAFALNRPGWVENLGYSLAEAVQILGPVRLGIIGALEVKTSRAWDDTKPMEL
jgi:hypothetical protein